MEKYNNIYEYPTGRKIGYIYAHTKLTKDLQKILQKSGYENEFGKKFLLRLDFLKAKREKCIIKSEWFECLKGSDGLFSMKIPGAKNIRILFALVKLNEMSKCVLLCGFEERRTKDYNNAILSAKKRLNEIMEEYKNEK